MSYLAVWSRSHGALFFSLCHNVPEKQAEIAAWKL
jgi:hypothetical protein